LGRDRPIAEAGRAGSPQTLHPWTAARLEREIHDERSRSWLDRAQAAVLLAGYAAVVVMSADRGAPPGWIAAGGVCFAIWAAVAIYVRLPRDRRVVA
jgi:hypothetical protein